jgi:hypothetical protein
VDDYNGMFEEGNAYRITLIVGIPEQYENPEGGVGVLGRKLTDIDHNGLVINQEVLDYIISLTTTSKEAN